MGEEMNEKKLLLRAVKTFESDVVGVCSLLFFVVRQFYGLF